MSKILKSSFKTSISTTLESRVADGYGYIESYDNVVLRCVFRDITSLAVQLANHFLLMVSKIT